MELRCICQTCKLPFYADYQTSEQYSYDGWSVGPNDIKVSVDESGNAKLDIVNKDFNFQDWITKNSADVRMPQVLECAKQLRSQYSWVGYVGYCWGGGVGFKVASKDRSGLFDSVTVAHSATPSEEEVHSIGVPFQILAAEHDPTFPPEVRDMCNREIPKLGVPYLFHHFPGVVHGFATKCDDSKASEKKALELAKNAVVFWMNSNKAEK